VRRANYVSVGDHNYTSFRDGGRMKKILRYSTFKAIHPNYTQVNQSAIPVNDVAVIKMMVPVRRAKWLSRML